MILGIDLGTTNSLGVVYKEGKSILIPTKWNGYITPSIVNVDKKTKQVKVGFDALREDILLDHTINNFKRHVGNTDTIVQNKRKYDPILLSSYIVGSIVQDAQNYLNETIDEIVISIPAYFNMNQRIATKRISELVGIPIKRIINEPSVAALHEYAMEQDETYIVFDLGGGTLDISVVDCFDTIVSICSISGDTSLGGIDFDQIIYDYVIKEADITINDTVNQRKIMKECENKKRLLSQIDEVYINFSYKDNEYNIKFSNELFYELSSALFIRIKEIIASAVKNSGYTKSDLDRVILVGGSCYMPIVQKFLSELLDLDIEIPQDLDTIVASGIGKYVGIMSRDKDIKEMVLTDICPFSLCVGIYNPLSNNRNLSSVIIKKNSVLPIHKTQYYQTVNLAQKSILFKITQGDNYFNDDNLYIGEIQIPVPVNKEEHEGVSVTFIYDINSILYIEVVVQSTQEIYKYECNEFGSIQMVSDENDIYRIKEIGDTLNYLSLEASVIQEFDDLKKIANKEEEMKLGSLLEEFQVEMSNLNSNNKRKKEYLMSISERLKNYRKTFLSTDVFTKDDEDSGGMLN